MRLKSGNLICKKSQDTYPFSTGNGTGGVGIVLKPKSCNISGVIWFGSFQISEKRQCTVIW